MTNKQIRSAMVFMSFSELMIDLLDNTKNTTFYKSKGVNVYRNATRWTEEQLTAQYKKGFYNNDEVETFKRELAFCGEKYLHILCESTNDELVDFMELVDEFYKKRVLLKTKESVL